MSILGHGIDLVSVSRFREVLHRQGNHFLERVFSPEEVAYCKAKADPAPHFAARFAAKEAYGKAMGLGLGPSGNFSDIAITHDERGAPVLALKDKAKDLFLRAGAKRALVSLSHDGDSAIASVVITS